MEDSRLKNEIENIWKNLRKKWYYPQIPEPIIIYDVGRVFIENYKIGFNIADLPADYEDRQIFIENFFEHEICHYTFCPKEIETVGELILSARDALKKYYNSDEIDIKEINLAVNFFTDLVVENFRYEKAKNNEKNKNILYHELKLQKIQYENVAISKIYLVLLHTLGNLWNYNFYFPFSEEIKSTGDLLSKMRNFSNKKLWTSYCYHTTFNIAKFLEEEINKKQRQEENKKEKKRGIFPLFLKELSSKIGKIRDGSKKDEDKSKGEEKKKDKEGQTDEIYDYFFYRSLEELQEKKKHIALQKIAEKNDIIEYKDVLKALGITDNEKEAIKRWYRDQTYGIEIHHIEKYDKTEYAIGPTKWRVEDPITELDFTYSLSLSNYLIPGITTFKRQFEEGKITPKESKVPDLLIVIDSSYSMGKHIRGTKRFFATLAAFKAYRYALDKGAKVAVINFSGKDNKPLFIQLEWTKDTESIEDHLIYNYGLYTCIPGNAIKEISKIKNVLIIILTDAQIQNFWSEIENLKEAAKENFLVIMCTAYSKEIAKGNPIVEELQKIGKIYFITKATDLIGLTIKTTRDFYEV